MGLKAKRIPKLIVYTIFFVSIAYLHPVNVNAQVKTNNEIWKWTTWTLLQAIPSPTLFEDRNSDKTVLRPGLEWQITPIMYSFSSNNYVSPFNFFFLNPVKRFAGSVELNFQPEFIPGGFKYSDLKKFMFKSGVRLNLPVFQKGEYLCFSLGGGYYYQKKRSNDLSDGVTYEAAVYSFFGMLGLKFNYNQRSESRFNIGLYFKYY